MPTIPRPTTAPGLTAQTTPPRHPLSLDQLQTIEINRLKAKALRQQRDSEAAQQHINGAGPLPFSRQTSSLAGQKRASSEISRGSYNPTSRDGTTFSPQAPSIGGPSGQPGPKPLETIKPARNFEKKAYIEYDFAKMSDTKGGFITTEDDPHNKALQAALSLDGKPDHMTLKEWEIRQRQLSLKSRKEGPYQPGLSVLRDKTAEDKCHECQSLEIDFKWADVFKCLVCNKCKEEYPDKYSMLTKSEAREDYLLTDPELKDEGLLPHLEKPNPHRSSWQPMMLYLRYQIEEYAFSDKKWGSPENLDNEFENRAGVSKKRKEDKFKTSLLELKKKTRVDAWKRRREEAEKGIGVGGAEQSFGTDVTGKGGRHVHEWGRAVTDRETGLESRKCLGCGQEVEEMTL